MAVVSGGVAGVSAGNFTIAPPYVTVLAPNGGESWIGGAIQSVRWASNIGGEVRLLWSSNAGAAWSVLVAGAPNVGLRYIPVPNVSTTQALIRVESLSVPASGDTSNRVFRVTTPAP
jgi:hypothetical protein